MLNAQSSENPSLSIRATDDNGNRAEILHVACSIRPGAGLYLNIDVLDMEKVTANMEGVQAEITAFAVAVFGRAAGVGLPVPALGGGVNA